MTNKEGVGIKLQAVIFITIYTNRNAKTIGKP